MQIICANLIEYRDLLMAWVSYLYMRNNYGFQLNDIQQDNRTRFADILRATCILNPFSLQLYAHISISLQRSRIGFPVQRQFFGSFSP